LLISTVFYKYRSFFFELKKVLITSNTTTAGANNQQWFLDGILQANSLNWSNTFNQNGGFQIMLVSTDGACRDTAFSFVSVGLCREANRAQNWYFGNFAGISFANGAPTTLLNSGMQGVEGTAHVGSFW
jgi:hypothetical protein